MRSQIYLVLIKDGCLALTVGAALEDRLLRDGYRATALVPTVRGTEFADSDACRLLAPSRSGQGPASHVPQVVALYEDGLLANLASLGLPAYVGVRDGDEPRIAGWADGPGAIMLPVATARDLVDAVADHTPWSRYAAVLPPARYPAARATAAAVVLRARQRGHDGPPARSRKVVAMASVAAGPLLLAGLPPAAIAAGGASQAPALAATASGATAAVLAADTQPAPPPAAAPQAPAPPTAPSASAASRTVPGAASGLAPSAPGVTSATPGSITGLITGSPPPPLALTGNLPADAAAARAAVAQVTGGAQPIPPGYNAAPAPVTPLLTGGASSLPLPPPPAPTGNPWADAAAAQAYTAQLSAAANQAVWNAIRDSNVATTPWPTTVYGRLCLGICLGAGYTNDGTNHSLTLWGGYGVGGSAGVGWGPAATAFGAGVQGRASLVVPGMPWISFDGMAQAGYQWGTPSGPAAGLDAALRGTVSVGPPWLPNLWIAGGGIASWDGQNWPNLKLYAPVAAGWSFATEFSGNVYGNIPLPSIKDISNYLASLGPPTGYTLDGQPYWLNLDQQPPAAPAAPAGPTGPPDGYTLDGQPYWLNFGQPAAPQQSAPPAAPSTSARDPNWTPVPLKAWPVPDAPAAGAEPAAPAPAAPGGIVPGGGSSGGGGASGDISSNGTPATDGTVTTGSAGGAVVAPPPAADAVPAAAVPGAAADSVPAVPAAAVPGAAADPALAAPAAAAPAAPAAAVPGAVGIPAGGVGGTSVGGITGNPAAAMAAADAAAAAAAAAAPVPGTVTGAGAGGGAGTITIDAGTTTTGTGSLGGTTTGGMTAFAGGVTGAIGAIGGGGASG